jgi:hypothetical protein
LWSFISKIFTGFQYNDLNHITRRGPNIMFSILSKLLCALSLLGVITTAHTHPNADTQATVVDLNSQHLSYNTQSVVMIAQAEDNQRQTQVPSGSLLLPESGGAGNEEEKKCMTVCGRWGEDCTYINRGAGGTTRSCRRTCQQFTQECF